MGRKLKKAVGYSPTVQVTPDAKNRFVAWIERKRSPHQGQTVGTILTWFTDQPRPVQDVVLGEVPEEVGPAYAAALARLAEQADPAMRMLPLPPDTLASLEYFAKQKNQTVAEYLATHVHARGTKVIVTPPSQPSGRSISEAAAPAARSRE